jgi:hypothetical protein
MEEVGTEKLEGRGIVPTLSRIFYFFIYYYLLLLFVISRISRFSIARKNYRCPHLGAGLDELCVMPYAIFFKF